MTSSNFGACRGQTWDVDNGDRNEKWKTQETKGGHNENLDRSQNEVGKKTFKTALPQILASSAKNMVLLGYGMTLGFPTIVIPSLQGGSDNNSTLVLNEEQISWFSSINHICVPLGCLGSGYIAQKLGRKRAMIVVNLPLIAAWIMYYFANSVYMLYSCLVLTGLSGGLLEAPVLTYVAEISQPHLRGFLSATASMCVILGVFVQFLLGNFMDWRHVATVNVSVPLVTIVMLCFVPESPHWLVSKGRLDEAQKVLCWLRGWVKPDDVKAEFSALVQSLKANSDQPPSCMDKLSNFTKMTFWKPYLLVCLSFFIGHFGGMTTLQTFAVSIFRELGSPINEYTATMLLGLVELGGTLLCVILIHWTGKRPLAFGSTLGGGMCFIIVATYAHLRDQMHLEMSWLPLTFLVLSAFLYHACIRLLPWVLIGEVYTSDVRGFASGASGAVGYIFGFLANKVYFTMIHSMTLPGAFWFYGAVSFVGTIYLYFFLPETEGRTLQDIQDHFAGKKNLKDKTSTEPEKWAADNPGLSCDQESHL